MDLIVHHWCGCLTVSPSTQDRNKERAGFVKAKAALSMLLLIHELRINKASCLVLGQEAMPWNLEPFGASLFGCDDRHPLD